ncbi:hypothetical protein ACIBL3_08865 [Kribbella sp. NPDC050124]|uniref:hypothetical protein n=1 Tax=Kribbella sp. NPDC050124 TaxID=3364114 RepID=UPI00379FC73C
MDSLLLLSSDDKRRYAEDIQTVLAAPEGFVVQFRYSARWATPAVRRAVSNSRAEGVPAVLGFAANTMATDPFVLPIRYATVVKAEKVAQMFIFQLRIGGYPNLQDYPDSLPGIVAQSRITVDQITAAENGVFHSATSNFPLLPAEATDNAPDRWLAAAERLALHRTYESSFFLRVASVETHQGKAVRYDGDGRLEAVDGQSLRIVTNIYTKRYLPDAGFKLTCTPGGPNLRIASDEVYDVALKYDVVDFWLFPAVQNYDTFSRVRISLASEKSDLRTVPAHVPLSFRINRSRSRSLRRWLATSAGAVLVALPAILGEQSPLGVRVAAALIGAGLLALSGAALSSQR